MKRAVQTRRKAKYKSHVQKWAATQQNRGVHPFAIGLALMALELVEPLLEYSKVFLALREFPVRLAKHQEWERFWRFERHMWRILLDFRDETGRALLWDLWRISRFAPALARELKRQYEAATEEVKAKVNEDLRGFLSEVRRDLEDLRSGKRRPVGEEPQVQPHQHEAIKFYLSVFLPCYVEYGCSPSELYARARSGDPQAIGKMQALDERAKDLPEIAEVLTKWMLEGRHDLGEVIEANRKVPKKEFTRKSAKGSIIAFLRAISEKSARGTKFKSLNASDICKLFDAVAKDNGRQGDTDLPASESLTKLVQRSNKASRISDLVDILF